MRAARRWKGPSQLNEENHEHIKTIVSDLKCLCYNLIVSAHEHPPQLDPYVHPAVLRFLMRIQHLENLYKRFCFDAERYEQHEDWAFYRLVRRNLQNIVIHGLSGRLNEYPVENFNIQKNDDGEFGEFVLQIEGIPNFFFFNGSNALVDFLNDRYRRKHQLEYLYDRFKWDNSNAEPHEDWNFFTIDLSDLSNIRINGASGNKTVYELEGFHIVGQSEKFVLHLHRDGDQRNRFIFQNSDELVRFLNGRYKRRNVS
jgi:hypothetical protein